MRLKFSKKKVCGVTRYKARCPDCKSWIMIDHKTFNNNQDSVFCYECDVEYFVVDINRKRGLSLEITKKETGNES